MARRARILLVHLEKAGAPLRVAGCRRQARQGRGRLRVKTPTTILLRLRVSRETIARIDKVAGELRGTLRRRIARAAITRALLVLGAEAPRQDSIVAALGADPVRRGRRRRGNASYLLH